MLELESQVAGVREQAEGREAELRHALEALRHDKKVLEDRVSALDAQAVQEGDQLVQKVRGLQLLLLAAAYVALDASSWCYAWSQNSVFLEARLFVE